MHWEIDIYVNHAEVSILGEVEGSQGYAILLNRIGKLVEFERKNILVDLTRLSFVNGSFCGLLVFAFKKAKDNQLKVSMVASLESFAYKIVHSAGLDRFIDVYTSKDLFLQSQPFFEHQYAN